MYIDQEHPMLVPFFGYCCPIFSENFKLKKGINVSKLPPFVVQAPLLTVDPLADDK